MSAAAPTPDVAPATPVAPEPQTQPAGPSLDKPTTFRGKDPGDVFKAKDKAPAPAPAKESEPTTEQQEEVEKQPDESRDPTERKLVEALKDVKDPKAKAQLRSALFQYKELGKYKLVAPTLEHLDALRHAAEAAHAMNDAYMAAEPESLVRFGTALNRANPEAWQTFTGIIADNLRSINETAYVDVGKTIWRDSLGIARGAAKSGKTDGIDPDDLAAAVDIMERWFGFANDGEQPAEPEMPEQYKRELEEARRIKMEARRQAEQRRQSEMGEFWNAAYGAVEQNVTGSLAGMINEQFPSLNDEAKANLFDNVAATLISTLDGNRVFQAKLRELVASGNKDRAHYERLVRFMGSTAEALLPQVFEAEANEFGRMFESSTRDRAERIERLGQSRDIGSQGLAPTPAPHKFSGKGKSPEQVLAEFRNVRGR